MMGKINKPNIEIIPINNKSNNNNSNNNDLLKDRQPLRMERLPYISDPTIVPRVQKYLECNVDKTYVDINVMADDLQRTYREYARLKRSSFRASVKKAYSIVLQSYGLEDQEGSSSDEEVSDDSAPDDSNNFRSETMNNQLANLYSRSSVPPPKSMDENELIDISSDDSESTSTVPVSGSGGGNGGAAGGGGGGGGSCSGGKTSNGPSTSSNIPAGYQNNIGKNAPERRMIPTNYERGKKRKNDSMATSAFQNASKKRKSLATLQEPSVAFKDIGGMDKILEEVCKLLIHLRHPEVYRQVGITPPRGFLLHGPPGCGKTLLANAIAGEIGVPLLKVAAPELVAGVSGESEERIRELFERAICSTPCILFIDEIDAITPNRQNAQKEMERRIVAQLLSCLDDLSQNESGDRVLVIGATNRPDSIDPALRRAGRFDREICLGIPDLHARTQILKVVTAKLRLTEDFNYEELAKFTPGYVGADLVALTREAAMIAVSRMFTALKEQRKLSEAIAIQKSLEAAKKTNENNDNKNDNENNEIIVDDDGSQSKSQKQQQQNDGGDGDAVVIIDDESIPRKKPSTTTTTTSSTPTLTTNEEEQELLPTTTTTAEAKVDLIDDEPIIDPVEPMPVDFIKQTTPLEDLLSWLHDGSPVKIDHLLSLCVTMDDFGKALKFVQPSAKREGFATVPDVTWDDVGSLRNVREELQMTILAPIRHSQQLDELGLTTPTGVLLCGPPGCGKTLIAKAIANEAGINFISVKGPELLNMYVGESERAVRVCFERARNSAPCVIFFDELDALCPKRSDSRDGGPTMRVVNQLLTEMDGIEERKGVFILAASNRPDIIDSAVLRPGRLDKILFVGLPNAADRVDILRAITKNGTKPRLSSNVDLEIIGKSEECQGYTGADLAALVREAGIIALKEFMLLGNTNETIIINNEHFKQALTKIRPSVSDKDQKHYEKLRKLYAAVPEKDVEEMEYS